MAGNSEVPAAHAFPRGEEGFLRLGKGFGV